MRLSLGPAGSAAAMRRERGSARLKFILVLAVVAIVGYMGFQYVPVAYQAYTFRKFMDDSTERVAQSGIPAEQMSGRVETQIRAGSKDYNVPLDARITPSYQGGRLEVSVQFKRPVNLLPGFTYQYNFDYTAKSNPFMNAPQ